MNKEAGAVAPTPSDQPREVLRQLFSEEMVERPDELSDLTVARLGRCGYLITPWLESPIEQSDLKREIARLQEAKRRAVAMADLRAKETTVLRAENAELRRRKLS